MPKEAKRLQKNDYKDAYKKNVHWVNDICILCPDEDQTRPIVYCQLTAWPHVQIEQMWNEVRK